MIDVALVGTGGMMPLPNRYLSSMICRHDGRLILFDCGEGSQVSLKLLGWGFKNIDAICFTHYHADHISGLPGVLLCIDASERKEPVRFFGPPGLEYFVRSLCVIAQGLSFPMEFTEWSPGKDHFAGDGDLTLRALPLRHRTPCFAYNIALSRRGKFDLERAKAGGVPMEVWSALQKQNDADIVYNHKRYTSDMVLGPRRRGLSVTYCTDTRPVPALVPFAKGSDLFICEGLHGNDDEKCAQHMHMSFAEAAEIAKKAEVGELWLTHFSPALQNPAEYLPVAAAIFPNTVIGRDRMKKTLRFMDD